MGTNASNESPRLSSVSGFCEANISLWLPFLNKMSSTVVKFLVRKSNSSFALFSSAPVLEIKKIFLRDGGNTGDPLIQFISQQKFYSNGVLLVLSRLVALSTELPVIVEKYRRLLKSSLKNLHSNELKAIYSYKKISGVYSLRILNKLK